MRVSQTYLLPCKIRSLGQDLFYLLPVESLLGFEDFLTCTETSDSFEEDEEVIYLAQDLCFLLSNCFFVLWLETLRNVLSCFQNESQIQISRRTGVVRENQQTQSP